MRLRRYLFALTVCIILGEDNEATRWRKGRDIHLAVCALTMGFMSGDDFSSSLKRLTGNSALSLDLEFV